MASSFAHLPSANRNTKVPFVSPLSHSHSTPWWRSSPSPPSAPSLHNHHRSRLLSLNATPSSESYDSSALPESREQAISQACDAIIWNAPSIPRKGGPSVRRLSIEIPVADESSEAAIALARDIIQHLEPQWDGDTFTIVSPSPINWTSNDVITLRTPPPPAPIIIAAPKTSQLSEIESFMSQWRGSVAILLNPEWAAEESDASTTNRTAFIQSFEPVYCFMPILIKAFVINQQEGAVFLCRSRPSSSVSGAATGGRKNKKATTKSSSGFGSSSATSSKSNTISSTTTTTATSTADKPWRIFMKEHQDRWGVVAAMAQRPSSTDVELAFYNASAANSPLTKGAQFLKEIGIGKKKDK